MKSIISGNEKGTCYLCGHIGQTEEHHIFSGPNRKLSEKYGLKIHLCPYCHRDNKNGAHGNKEIADHLHRIGQAAFERNHTREDFMQIFGKNYLDQIEDTAEEIKLDEQQDEELDIVWLNSQKN